MHTDPLTAWHVRHGQPHPLESRPVSGEFSKDALLLAALEARSEQSSAGQRVRWWAQLRARAIPARSRSRLGITAGAARRAPRVSALTSAAVCAAVAWPASVEATSPQIDGVGVFDTEGTTCAAPPAGYEDYTDYPPIVLTGDLNGCWYTKVESVTDHGAPSGIYLETGREVFVGSLDGGPTGLFTTTYRFESKWDLDVSSGIELHGRCQHPIVRGSGVDGFAGVTGRLDFKDIVADGSYVYRGHLKMP